MYIKLNYMRTIHELDKEMYVSPEAEVIMISAASTILSNEGGEEGGNHDWDQPQP